MAISCGGFSHQEDGLTTVMKWSAYHVNHTYLPCGSKALRPENLDDLKKSHFACYCKKINNRLFAKALPHRFQLQLRLSSFPFS